MTYPRIRVAAYVIRRASTAPELLVFDHVGIPEAGTQIPAGGVAAGEDPVHAVLREVTEETGLSAATVLRRIAVEDKPHPETRKPRRTTFYYVEAPKELPDTWHHQVHGEGTDAGYTFACRFAPLPLAHPLADDQDTWLGHIDPAWATTVDRLP